MASSVNTDWNNVKSTAQSQLTATQSQIMDAQKQYDSLNQEYLSYKRALDNQTRFYEEKLQQFKPNPVLSEILPLQEAYQKDPTNAAKKAAWETAKAKFDAQVAKLEQETRGFEGVIRGLSSAANIWLDKRNAVSEQLSSLVGKQAQLQKQIDEANRQLGIQSSGTAPGTSNVNSATTVPASSNPGNASIATTTVKSQQTVSSNTEVRTTSVASGSKTAVPRPTAEAKPVDKPATTTNPSDLASDYTVKKGDTLSSIAKKYGTTVEALLKANPQIKNANLIKVGQVIRIPGKEEEIPDPEFDDTDILLSENIQTAFDQANFDGLVQDWRVRLALAPGADYFYMGADPGILEPLITTNGVVFPYTPNIQVNYVASYNPIELTHSNYRVFQYSNSSVEQVTITCDFTAQDAYEARYLLAVIHFFRTMTKMFYGQDEYPIRGTPPPLCYMFGMGAYQFAAHPLVINQFNYNLPNDVDYIATTAPISVADRNAEREAAWEAANATNTQAQDRLGDGVKPGGTLPRPTFNIPPKDITTWVPTKISLSIGCYPIMSRNQVSNYFSLNDYASGYLIKGTSRPGGGMW